MKPSRRTHAILLAALLLLNAAVKITLWVQPPQTFPDSSGYLVPALRLLDLREYGAQENGFRTPTYPLFLAAILAPFNHAELSSCRNAREPACLGGVQDTPGALANLRAVAAVQIVLGILTILLVYGFAWRISQNAWIAALCALTYPIDLSTGYWEISLLSDALTIFLVALAAYLTLVAATAARHRLTWHAALGFALGALALCHSTFLLYAVIPFVFLFLWARRPRGEATPPHPNPPLIKGREPDSALYHSVATGNRAGLELVFPPLRKGREPESALYHPVATGNRAGLELVFPPLRKGREPDSALYHSVAAGERADANLVSTLLVKGRGPDSSLDYAHLAKERADMGPTYPIPLSSEVGVGPTSPPLDKGRVRVGSLLVVLLIPALLILAWSARNARVDGYFTPSSLTGYNLTQMVGPFMERAPAPYRDLADIYLQYRADRIAVRGSHSGTIFFAYRDMLDERGITWADLSRVLTTMSVQMIIENPVNYWQVAWESFNRFWKFGLGRQNPVLPISFDWVKWFLDSRVHEAFMVLFFLSPLALVLARRLDPSDAPRSFWIWFALATVWYAALFSSAFNFGDNERYRAHVARLQYSTIILTAWWVARQLRLPRVRTARAVGELPSGE